MRRCQEAFAMTPIISPDASGCNVQAQNLCCTSAAAAEPSRELSSVGPVMSSCLCKYGEGAGFPFQIESLEDGVDDAVHALDIHKANHGPGAASHLHEAALD